MNFSLKTYNAGPYIAYAADGKWKVKGVEDGVGVFGDEAEAAGLKMKNNTRAVCYS